MESIFVIFGLAIIFFLLIVMSYVYLNRDAYLEQTPESRDILRLFGSIFAALSSFLLFEGGGLNLQTQISTFAVEASGSIAVFVFTFIRWGKFNEEIKKEQIEKIVSEDLEGMISASITDEILKNPTTRYLDNSVHKADFDQAIKEIAKDAKRGIQAASSLLIKLDREPSIRKIIDYFESTKPKIIATSSYERLMILASLYLAIGDPQNSRTAVDTVLQNDPENLSALEVKALLLEREGKEKEAAQLVQKLISKLEGANDKESKEKTGGYYSFLAQLSTDKEAQESLWHCAAGAYDGTSNFYGKAQALFNMESTRETAVELVDLLEDSPLKTQIMRHQSKSLFKTVKAKHSPDIDAIPALLDKAIAILSQAKQIDEKIQNKGGEIADTNDLAICHAYKGNLEFARELNEKSIVESREISDWKALRSSMLSRAEIEEYANDSGSFEEWAEKARVVSEQFNDQNSADIIETSVDHKLFELEGKNLGMYRADGEIDENKALAGMRIIEKFGSDEFAPRMKAYSFRQLLLENIAGATHTIGAGAEESKALFDKLGFSMSDELGVNLLSWRAYTKSFQDYADKVGLSDYIASLESRQRLANLMERTLRDVGNIVYKSHNYPFEPSPYSSYFRILIRFLRMGFDLEDTTIVNINALQKERASAAGSLAIMSLDEEGKNTDYMSSIVNHWADAWAAIQDKKSTDDQRHIAIFVINSITPLDDWNDLEKLTIYRSLEIGQSDAEELKESVERLRSKFPSLRK